MRYRKLVQSLSALAWVGTASWVGWAQDKPAPSAPQERPLQLQLQLDAETGVVTGIVHQDVEARVESDYWLGIGIGIDDQGLSAQQVMSDGPAAKAGLQAGDRLVNLNGKPLKEFAELLATVKASGGKPVTLEIERAGQRHTIAITPARRPASPPILGGDSAPPVPAPREPGIAGEGPRLQLLPHPTTTPLAGIGPAPHGMAPALPDDVEITIKKKGSRPARIKVRQGAQSWTVSEHELGKLPPAFRPHVARMLPPSAAAHFVPPGVAAPAPFDPYSPPANPFVPTPPQILAKPRPAPEPTFTFPIPVPAAPAIPAPPVPPGTLPPSVAPPAIALPGPVPMPVPPPFTPAAPADPTSALRREVDELKRQIHDLRQLLDSLRR